MEKIQDLTIKFNNSSINELLTIVQDNVDPTDNAKIYITVNAGVTNFTGTKELTYKVDKAEQSITVEQETITVEYGTNYETLWKCNIGSNCSSDVLTKHHRHGQFEIDKAGSRKKHCDGHSGTGSLKDNSKDRACNEEKKH